MRYLANTAKKPKPWLVCSKDQTRPTLTHVNLTLDPPRKDKPRTGHLSATDSYCLVTVPVEFDDRDEEPKEGAFPIEALKAGDKIGAVFALKDGVREPGTGTLHPYPENPGQFPNADKLMPSEENVSSFHIAFNAALLKKLADAMGSEAVVLEFCAAPGEHLVIEQEGAEPFVMPANLRAIRVRPIEHSGGGTGAKVLDGPVGLLMPIRMASR